MPGVLVAWLPPQWLVPLKVAIVPLPGLVMIAMGMTLTAADFLTVLRHPFPVVLGVVLQFLLMPFAAWALAKLAGLPPEQAGPDLAV